MGLNRIKRISRSLKWLFTGMMAVPPLAACVVWLFLDHWLAKDGGTSLSLMGSIPPNIPVLGPITGGMKGLGLLVTLAPVGLQMALFWYLARLFGLYQQGAIFTIESVGCLRRVGAFLLIGAIVQPFHGALVTLVLTMNNPAGQHMITLGLSGDPIGKAMTALVVFLISWIMDEGRKLQEDQALTV
jgi:hypothetical protein